MDPLVRRVTARFVEATKGRSDQDEVPVVHKPSGRIVYVLKETLKDNPGLYTKVPAPADRDSKPPAPPRPPKPSRPAKPRRPEIHEDPYPRLPPYPPVPIPPRDPPSAKPLKKPRPLKLPKVPKPPRVPKRVVIPNKPKTAMAVRVAIRYMTQPA